MYYFQKSRRGRNFDASSMISGQVYMMFSAVVFNVINEVLELNF